jgi:hypothetical protein
VTLVTERCVRGCEPRGVGGVARRGIAMTELSHDKRVRSVPRSTWSGYVARVLSALEASKRIGRADRPASVRQSRAAA